MTSFNILLLPGDGIGTEVAVEVKKVLKTLADVGAGRFEVEDDLIGGVAYDACGAPIAERTMDRAKAADFIIMGAVGGPKWEDVPYDLRPEAAMLRLRKELGLFANLRPAKCYSALADASSLKREAVDGLDVMIVRELTGGLYFGEPKEIVTLENGDVRGVDTQVYKASEISRIATLAFSLARTRRNKVTSVDKKNVMRTGKLWRETVSKLHGDHYRDVALSHALADSCAMQLVRSPLDFDVLLTDNLFGDLLSDIAGALTGSLGLLPSASLGETDAATGTRKALYEPVHGSAPDIAGKGLANPIAMIGSLAMALRYSANAEDAADLLEQAITNVLDSGFRTADIAGSQTSAVSTSKMGDAICSEVARLFG